MNACPAPPFELSDVLTCSPIGQLRRLSVRETDTEVVITGRVSSYYLKQMAQEALRAAAGHRAIRNAVEVCASECE
jgi:hypothetical protein